MSSRWTNRSKKNVKESKRAGLFRGRGSNLQASDKRRTPVAGQKGRMSRLFIDVKRQEKLDLYSGSRLDHAKTMVESKKAPATTSLQHQN